MGASDHGSLKLWILSGSMLTLVAVFSTIPAATAQAEILLSLNKNNWTTITEGKVDLKSDASGLSFDFPVAANGRISSDNTMNALMTNYAKSIAAAKSLSATFKVVTTGSPVFNYVFERSNTCVNPAHARLWFARSGWREGGEFFRWWAKTTAYRLGAGIATLTVPLTPNEWSSVFGKSDNNSASLEGFQSALQNVGQVGLVFGGGCFFGHGVNVSGGTAQFTLTNYSIR